MSSSQSIPVTSDLDYSDLYLNVVLRDVNNDESFPIRHFPVGSTWSFKIGRGSQNENQMNPRPHNSWFGSRVMSREHAEVIVNQNTREIHITDLTSMHGTFMYGRKLRAGEKTKLYPHDVVTFGTDVVRGEHTYRPLQLKFEFEWSDGTEQPGFAIDRYQGSFASNYLNESVTFDDEVEVIGSSSINRHTAESPLKPRTFSVPDSDDSDDDSADDANERSSPLTFDEEITGEVVEVDPSKLGPVIQNSARVTIEVEELPQETRSQVVVLDGEETHHSQHENTFSISSVPQAIQETLDQAPNLSSNEHEDEDEDEDEDDQDFDSEAADFHMHASDEDDDSVNEDIIDNFDEDFDELDESDAQEDVQVPQFLQTVLEELVPEQYIAPSSRDHDIVLPPINDFVGSSHKIPETSMWNVKDETVVISEPVRDTAYNNLHGTGRVSINNIINDNDEPVENRLKRKVDELIDHEHDESEFRVPFFSGVLPNLDSTPVSVSKTEKLSEEPPRKLVKVESSPQNIPSRRKAFLKYTATAVAGAAVGAVTAVFGLAALPADYFV